MNEKFLSRGKRLEIGQRIVTTSDEWIYGYYVYGSISTYIYSTLHNPKMVSVDPKTVGRCIGLTDKNGKTIFEGDILQAGDYRFVVKFGKCDGVQNVDHEVGYIGFYVIPIGKDSELFIESGVRTDILYWLNAYEVYVIGNIHDNPELIGGTE